MLTGIFCQVHGGLPPKLHMLSVNPYNIPDNASQVSKNQQYIHFSSHLTSLLDYLFTHIHRKADMLKGFEPNFHFLILVDIGSTFLGRISVNYQY